ncbi:Hypothetical protein FKW44_006166, partial [Caligus rogercresseyi]
PTGRALSLGDLIREKDLRKILISRAVRYSALSIKIPWTSGERWKQLAGEVVKFYPSCYLNSTKDVKMILRFYRKL